MQGSEYPNSSLDLHESAKTVPQLIEMHTLSLNLTNVNQISPSVHMLR